MRGLYLTLVLIFWFDAGTVSAGGAGSLDSRLAAAETRVTALSRDPGGSGVEVLLSGTDPIVLRASDGATEADLVWANHVRLAYELALTLGGSSLDRTLITQSFSQAYSVAVEGGRPVAGDAASQVLAAFFKALIGEAEDISVDLYVAVLDAPDDWGAVLKAIRSVSVSTPSLIAGTQGHLSLPAALNTGVSVSTAQSPTPGISVDSVSVSGGHVAMTITVAATVPKGLHPVYFYTDDSKFEPAATVTLRIDPPPQ